MSTLTLEVSDELAARLEAVPHEQWHRHAVAALSRLTEGRRNTPNEVIAPVLRLLDAPPNRSSADNYIPVPGAVTKAVEWLLSLSAEISGETSQLTPLANVSPEGEVVLEWWQGGRKLTIYISDSAIEYLQVWGKDIEAEMSEGDADSAETPLILWKWLTNSFPEIENPRLQKGVLRTQTLYNEGILVYRKSASVGRPMSCREFSISGGLK